MATKKTTTKKTEVKKPVKKVKKAEKKTEKAVKTVKATKVEKVEKVEKVVESIFSGQYFYAVGKRKTAIAQVRIYPLAKGEAKFQVNGKPLEKFMILKRLNDVVLSPFQIAGQEGKFNLSAKVYGGGFNAQAEAIRLGIARALVTSDESLRKVLKAAKLLTRDARKVERKKPGLKKARRSPQWAKR